MIVRVRVPFKRVRLRVGYRKPLHQSTMRRDYYWSCRSEQHLVTLITSSTMFITLSIAHLVVILNLNILEFQPVKTKNLEPG